MVFVFPLQERETQMSPSISLKKVSSENLSCKTVQSSFLNVSVFLFCGYKTICDCIFSQVKLLALFPSFPGQQFMPVPLFHWL